MKFISLCLVLVVCTVLPAFAGVMDTVKAVGGAVTNPEGIMVGVGLLLLAWLFKVIPNDKLYAFMSKFARGLGVAVTLGMSRYKFTRPFWHKVIEPWFTDFLNNTFHAFVTGFIDGLKSDNTDG